TYTASAGLPAQVGDTITYTYYITNTGTVTLYTITLDDDKLGLTSLTPPPLAPGSSKVFTDTTIVVENDLLYSFLTNTVAVTGVNTLSEITVATDTASVPLTYTIGITVVKTASQATASPGDTVTYTYRITNTGDITLTVILYDDELDTYPPLSAMTVAPQNSVTGTAVKLVNAGDLPGPIVNTAIVTGANTIVSQTVMATNTAVVTLTYTTAISLEKRATPSSATLNQVITYRYTITNTGQAPLDLILSDDKLGPLSPPVTPLAPGLSTVVITTHTVSQLDLLNYYPLLTNTATVSGTYLTTTVTEVASAAVTLVYTPAIQLAKTANVTATAPGEVITYTYTVTNTGPLTVTILALDDDRLGSLLARLGTTTLGPNNDSTTATITYTVKVTDTPAITNTAIVTGQDTLGRVPTATKTLVVDVEEKLLTISAVNDSPTVVNTATQFTVTTNITNGVTYVWNFADGTPLGSGMNPSHTYTSVGTYTAVVTAFNSISTIYTTTVVTITPGPPVRFDLQANSPQTAGVPFTLTITALDAYGNPTPFSGPATIADTTGTIAPTPVTVVNGITITTVTVTQATSPLSDTITATDDGTGTITGTIDVEIRPNTPTTLTITANPNVIHICETALVTTTLTDRWNNPTPEEPVNLSLLAAPATGIIVPNSGNTNANGMVSSILTGTGTLSGNVRILGEWATNPAVNNFPGYFVQVITPTIPTVIAVTVSPASVSVGGSAVATATVTDCNNNPVNGLVVTFTIPALYGTVNPLTATTVSGIATTTVTAGLTPGTTAITGAAEGPLSDDTPFTITPSTMPTLTINKTATPPGGTVPAGSSITYQIVVANSGTAPATGVVITDALDSDVGFVTGSIVPVGSGPVDTGGGVITFSVASLGSGVAVTATIQVNVTAALSGTIIANTATANSHETAPVTSTIVTHQVITTPPGSVYLPIILKNAGAAPLIVDLTVRGVTVSNTSPNTGDPVDITVTLHNTGTAFATPFWVDLYLSTNSALNPAVNRPWDEAFADTVVPYGVAWKVYGMPADGDFVISNLNPNDLAGTCNNYSNFIPNGLGCWPQTWKCMPLNNYFGDPRTYYLYVRVDSLDDNYPTSQNPNGEVLETDENNNLHIFSIPINVGGTPILPNPFNPPPCSTSIPGLESLDQVDGRLPVQP
ncbi:MAG: PKD domain-containing protein, partial [Anaerolineae bacterium]|nr:PKD domain-containing protein [Anaerolineae bacterium]